MRNLHIGSLGQVLLESKTLTGHCLPLDTLSIKPGQKWMCANTHIFNIIQSLLSSFIIGGAINYVFTRQILRSFKLGGIFSLLFSAQPLIEQMFARDFCLIDQKNNLEFSEEAMGTPIIACNNGKVVAADKMRGAYGNVIMIQHSDWCYSAYGHLQTSSMLVKKGDKVRKGQRIASLGNTGNSTAPHLHFEMLFTNPDNDIPIIPTKIGRPLDNFESFHYIPLEFKEFYSSTDPKKFFTNLIHKMKNKWQMNNTGEILSFCFIKNK